MTKSRPVTSSRSTTVVLPAARRKNTPHMQTVLTTPRTAGTGVRLRGIRRAFDNGVVALDGIDLNVAPGEFLAILGPSGCGKSTLLRLIAGLDQPQEGSVNVSDGADAADAQERVKSAVRDTGVPPVPVAPGPGDPHHLQIENRQSATISHTPAHARGHRADIAYVFQDAHLLPWRNVLDNVALPLELMHVRARERSEASRRAIEQVGLTDAISRYPNQLSGGMRMRVSLARAMVTEPRLLLLDEPFAALDEITRQRLDEQLQQLWADRGMTVVFVTHSTVEAVFLAGRAIVMSKRPGRFIEDHPIALPADRPAEIRGTPAFAREMRVLYDALERGGA
ncbi:MAG: transporter ATP-binding protein [Phycisphaerales bacterium]|nr:transporter ATP-binding protein [Phycisphaerales bacterium]